LRVFIPIILACWVIVACYPSKVLGKDVLDLDLAIKEALENSPLLLSSRHEEEASLEAKRGAKGSFLPQIEAYADYSRLSDPAVIVPIKSFNGTPPAFSRDQYRAGMRIRIPLYHGGRLRSQLTIAEFSRAVAQADVRFTTQELIANVTNTYNRILHVRSLISAQEEILSALEKARDDTKRRLEVGRVALLDLLRIETQVAEQRQALIESREDEKRLKQTLAMLLGRDPMADLEIVGELSRPDTSFLEREGLRIDEIVEKRPDVIRAKKEVKLAKTRVRLAKGLHLPSIDIVGDYGRRAGSGLYEGEEVWSAGMTLSINVFSGGVISARVNEAEAKLLSARERLRWARLNGKTEVLHALSSFREAEHRYEVARSATLAAKETFRIEDLKYRSGAGTVTDALLAHSAWLKARANELSAMYDMKKAVVDYLLASGSIGAGLDSSRSARNLEDKN